MQNYEFARRRRRKINLTDGTMKNGEQMTEDGRQRTEGGRENKIGGCPRFPQLVRERKVYENKLL